MPFERLDFSAALIIVFVHFQVVAGGYEDALVRMQGGRVDRGGYGVFSDFVKGFRVEEGYFVGVGYG